MKSDLLLLSELWEAVKPSVISSDRSQVTDTIVSMIIDHGHSVDDISEAFRGDAEIIEALKYYADEGWAEEIEESEDYDDEDDDDEWE
jgi:uncharacterized protein (DUF433 family)